MKHWQYTETPNVCQQCGYKTCSLPTYRRHVKYCSASTTPSETDSVSASGHQESSPASSDAVNLRKCQLCQFSSSNKEFLLHLDRCHRNKDETDVEGEGAKRTKEVAPAPGAKKVAPKSKCTFDGDKVTDISDVQDCNDVEIAQEENFKGSSGTRKRCPDDGGLKREDCPEILPETDLREEPDDRETGGKHPSSVPERTLPKVTVPSTKKVQPSSKVSILKKVAGKSKPVTVQSDVIFGCSQCNFTSPDAKIARSHVQLCGGQQGRKYSCSSCEFSCDNKLLWIKHKLQNHEDESSQKTIHSCNECLYKTPLKKNFERHLACHNLAAAFRCSCCSYSSSGESAVRRHFYTYHSVGENPGSENPKECKTKSSSKVESSSGCTDSPQNKKSGKESESAPKDGSSGKANKVFKKLPPGGKGATASARNSDMRKKVPNSMKSPRVVESMEVVAVNAEPKEDSEAVSGVESQEEEVLEKFPAEEVGDIVWSCFYCKLDFKQRRDMEAHTKAEHSISLKDCVMYSLEKESLFELDQEEEDSPNAEDDDDDDDKGQLRCAFCDFKGRRPYDLRRHFERKHGHSHSKQEQNGCKRSHEEEESPVAQSLKKAKLIKPMITDSSTILAKLLQNDDPNSVYKPSNGSSSKEVVMTQKQKTGSKSAVGRSWSSEVIEDIADVEKPDGGDAQAVKNSPSRSNSPQNSDREVEYLTSLMCTYCGYLGNNPGEVERHTKIHTGEKNYWCPCCNYKTIWKCDIKRHLEKFHPIESDTPDRLHQLLHRAFRPDGKHTAEELGYQLVKGKAKVIVDGLTKLKAHGGFKKLMHSVKYDKHVTATIDSSKKLLQKAKTQILLHKVLHAERKDSGERSSEPITDGAAVATDTASSLSGKALQRKLCPERCRPYKCSVCGRRSNWKWDMKKHIADQHPTATLITLSSEEARKSLAEIIHQKQRLSGFALQAQRLRIGPSYRRGEQDLVLARDARILPRKNPASSLASFAGKSILKGMVDLQKLKRFKCSGCIYRSNFRGDISRHIRARHLGRGCSVIVMAADVAAASLSSYECRWKMRKIDPTVLNEITPSLMAASTNADDAKPNPGNENNGKSRFFQRSKPIDSLCSGGGSGKKWADGNGRRNGGETEDVESFKRRERPQMEEDDLKCCAICPYVTEKSDVLKLHMSYHQPQARNGFSCTHCPYFVNTERLLDHHLQLHISKDSLAVNRGGATYAPKVVSGAAFESKYICDTCPYVSRQRSDYWAHRRNHFEKSDATFKCTICPYWTKEQRQLSSHVKLHSKSYFPWMILQTNDRKGDGVSCRCTFAEIADDARFQCGRKLLCPYCSYAIASMRLMRQHMVFHVSFTDAAKNLFFQKKFDDADSYLFVHCKNRPLVAKELENGTFENGSNDMEVNDVISCSSSPVMNPGQTPSPVILHDAELWEKDASECCFMPLDATADDAISVATMDTDLPELEMFPCGNSEISEKRESPDFLEAVLMQEVPYSRHPEEETVSVVELSSLPGAFPSEETISVIHLPLTEFLSVKERSPLEPELEMELEGFPEAALVVELTGEERRSEEIVSDEIPCDEMPPEWEYHLERRESIGSPEENEMVSVVDLPSIDHNYVSELTAEEPVTREPLQKNKMTSQLTSTSEFVSVVDMPSGQTNLVQSGSVHGIFSLNLPQKADRHQVDHLGRNLPDSCKERDAGQPIGNRCYGDTELPSDGNVQSSLSYLKSLPSSRVETVELSGCLPSGKCCDVNSVTLEGKPRERSSPHSSVRHQVPPSESCRKDGDTRDASSAIEELVENELDVVKTYSVEGNLGNSVCDKASRVEIARATLAADESDVPKVQADAEAVLEDLHHSTRLPSQSAFSNRESSHQLAGREETSLLRGHTSPRIVTSQGEVILDRVPPTDDAPSKSSDSSNPVKYSDSKTNYFQLVGLVPVV